MALANGQTGDNPVCDFGEGWRIAWMSVESGQRPPGHLGVGNEIDHPRRTHPPSHTYDWRPLTVERRLARARTMTSGALGASLDRLAALAERS